MRFLHDWVRRTREKDRRAVAEAFLTVADCEVAEPMLLDLFWSLAMDVYLLDLEERVRIRQLERALTDPLADDDIPSG